MGKLHVGESQGYGNTGDPISVKLPNGKTINTTAATPINTSQVLVAVTDSGTAHSFSNPSITTLSDREITRRRPRKKAAIVSLDYPFLVIFAGTLEGSDYWFIGGNDDDQALPLGVEGFEILGMNNLGDGQFTWIGYSDDTYYFGNEIPDPLGSGLVATAIALIPSQFISNDVPSFSWYGGVDLYASQSKSPYSLHTYTPPVSYNIDWRDMFNANWTQYVYSFYPFPRFFDINPINNKNNNNWDFASEGTYTESWDYGSQVIDVNGMSVGLYSVFNLDSMPTEPYILRLQYDESYIEQGRFYDLDDGGLTNQSFDTDVIKTSDILWNEVKTPFTTTTGANTMLRRMTVNELISRVTASCTRSYANSSHVETNTYTKTQIGTIEEFIDASITSGLFPSTATSITKKDMVLYEEAITSSTQLLIKTNTATIYTYNRVNQNSTNTQFCENVKVSETGVTTTVRDLTTIIDNNINNPNTITLVVKLSGSVLEIKDFTEGGGFNFEGRFFLRCDSLGTGLTSTNYNIQDYQIGVSSNNYGNYSKVLKRLQSNSVSNPDGTKTYHSMIPFNGSGQSVEIYNISNGNVTKYNGTISGLTGNADSNDDGEEWTDYSQVTLSVDSNSASPQDFYCWANVYSNAVMIVPEGDHTISLLKYIEQDKKTVNMYESGDTIQIAISKKLTPDNLDEEEDWYADIYEFNTTEKKFERLGNESGALSEISGMDYDLISYYPV